MRRTACISLAVMTSSLIRSSLPREPHVTCETALLEPTNAFFNLDKPFCTPKVPPLYEEDSVGSVGSKESGSSKVTVGWPFSLASI